MAARLNSAAMSLKPVHQLSDLLRWAVSFQENFLISQAENIFTTRCFLPAQGLLVCLFVAWCRAERPGLGGSYSFPLVG